MVQISLDGIQVFEGRNRPEQVVKSGVLLLEFPEGTTSLSYVDTPDGYSVLTSTPPVAATIGNTNVLFSNAFFAEAIWGTFSTTVLVSDPELGRGDFYFIAPLEGATYPDFDVRGGNDLWAEFDLLPYENLDVRRGPFKPSQPIDLDEIDNQTLDDNLRQGNQADNVIRGTNKDDAIVGMGGNDKLFGRGGFDTILSGKGNDTAFGGNGGDILVGFAGDDVLSGGKGSDALVGGEGVNTLRGGPGADSFIFLGGAETTTIVDFSSTDDLGLSDALWDGADLSRREIVQQFASVEKGNVVIDFGPDASDTRIIIENLDTLDFHSSIFFV